MSARDVTPDESSELQGLWQAAKQGDRRALARLLTLAGQSEHKPTLYRLLAHSSPPRSSLVSAITGSPGAGKSSLIGKMLPLIRQQGHTVAVLACDPRSPLTGGALLGDRIRMPVTVEDQGIYIRSLATPPGRQGIAESLDIRVGILEHSGFDWILVETVGVGQGDVAVRDLVDCVVLLIPPESGDEIQWEKAGLLELADLVVVSKGDMPGATRTAAQLQQTLNLPGFPPKQILVVSVARNLGIAELVKQLHEQPRRRHAPERRGQRLLLLAQEILAERFAERKDLVQGVLAEARRQGWDDWQAANELVHWLMTHE
ncbi:putative GTPase [bacterium HR36]|nr:putative GTPase [bacterium HR36]